MQEEQRKKSSDVVSDAAVKEDLTIPAKPTDLSDEELDKVAGGGTLQSFHIQSPSSTKKAGGTLYGGDGNDSRAGR